MKRMCEDAGIYWGNDAVIYEGNDKRPTMEEFDDGIGDEIGQGWTNQSLFRGNCNVKDN
jgi:hypothetical protein